MEERFTGTSYISNAYTSDLAHLYNKQMKAKEHELFDSFQFQLGLHTMDLFSIRKL
jgi:hypothetical protein